MATVAETIVQAIADLGVRSVWGVVGDALNPITDAIRLEDRLEWIGVRHEEAGAFAAGAQAQLGAGCGRSASEACCRSSLMRSCSQTLARLVDVIHESSAK